MSIASQNSAEISHILGIDFGQAKVGLAVADTETKIAFALSILENNNQLLDNLREIIQEKEIGKIVLGITKYGNKEDPNKNNFGKKLEENFKIPVELHNEMFTTKMAQNNLKESGAKNIGKIDDSESAKIILQSWLDRN